MAKVTRNFFLTLARGLAMAASAQNLDMTCTDRSTTFDAPGKPTRGMTQGNVQSKFGSPVSVRAPVGDPPITRWEYPDFVVFFEYDKVIHAVVKR